MYALIGVVKPLYVFFQLRETVGSYLSDQRGKQNQQVTKVVYEEKLYSSKFSNFNEALEKFLTREELKSLLKDHKNTLVYLSLAGPVFNQECSLSLLEWRIDSDELKKEYGFREVYISNDAKSTCEGVLELFKQNDHEKFSKISAFGEPRSDSLSILVELHTGLGYCMIIPAEKKRKVFCGEGGHTDFIAVDQIEWDLKTFIQKNFSFLILTLF